MIEIASLYHTSLVDKGYKAIEGLALVNFLDRSLSRPRKRRKEEKIVQETIDEKLFADIAIAK